MTSSKYVVDIYSYCGNSGIFEYGTGGDIYDLLWPKSSKSGSLLSLLGNTSSNHQSKSPFQSKLGYIDKLKIALHVAMAVADIHNVDKEGSASIAHADITPSQFIYIDGIFKLNDFNRCRFISWNYWKNQPCEYRVRQNPGKFRSPEEYHHHNQSEKVDVYSMGNVFYTLLTEIWPFDKDKEDVAQHKVMAGDRPEIPEHIYESKDPSAVVLRRAISMCWAQKPNVRANARTIEQFLTDELEKILK